MDNTELARKIDQLRKDLNALNAEYYTNNFSASQDFNKYSRFNTRIKVPVVTALASVCELGELCVFSGKLYVASAANTWTIVGTQVA